MSMQVRSALALQCCLLTASYPHIGPYCSPAIRFVQRVFPKVEVIWFHQMGPPIGGRHVVVEYLELEIVNVRSYRPFDARSMAINSCEPFVIGNKPVAGV